MVGASPSPLGQTPQLGNSAIESPHEKPEETSQGKLEFISFFFYLRSLDKSLPVSSTSSVTFIINRPFCPLRFPLVWP